MKDADNYKLFLSELDIAKKVFSFIGVQELELVAVNRTGALNFLVASWDSLQDRDAFIEYFGLPDSVGNMRWEDIYFVDQWWVAGLLHVRGANIKAFLDLASEINDRLKTEGGENGSGSKSI